jgi:hypothetical protein
MAAIRPLLLIVLLLAISLPIVAQNDIVANPKAVKLRRIWTMQGAQNSNAEYGVSVGSIFDVTGDGINEVTVYRGIDHRTLFFKGGSPAPDTVPFLHVDSVGPAPIAGDFWGTGKRQLAFLKVFAPNYIYYRAHIFEIDSEHISEIPMTGRESRGTVDLQALNLDSKAGDELVQINALGDTLPEVLIFQGGAGFQLDKPTVAIPDSGLFGPPDQFHVNFADFDGDGRIDMAMSGLYPGVGAMIRFYWGDDRSPYSWAERPPDRDLKLADSTRSLGVPIRPLYLDGDNAADLTGSISGNSPDRGTYIFLTNSGKSARTRSFTLDDADISYRSTPFIGVPMRVGFLSDSTRHYEMLAMTGNSTTVFLAGGVHGPDNQYDGYMDVNDQIAFSQQAAVRDVSGDGWDDYIVADYTYNNNAGIAIIFAGGPYIPRDSTSLGVRDIAVAGQPVGLSLWPNPIHDELNIAWRGDLTQMPSRFEVHDLLGRLVASGQVEPWRGAALWRCTDVAAGTYLLTISDHNGNVIATTGLIKQ